jgi:hypothetical protein
MRTARGPAARPTGRLFHSVNLSGKALAVMRTRTEIPALLADGRVPSWDKRPR